MTQAVIWASRGRQRDKKKGRLGATLRSADEILYITGRPECGAQLMQELRVLGTRK